MAVFKPKPEKFMPMVLQIIKRSLTLPEMIIRTADDAFVGAKDDTVNMRVGELRTVARRYEWRSRTQPIVLDDIEGGESIPVKLDTHTYSATGITLEQATLDEINWTKDVMVPQARAVKNALENDVRNAFLDMETRHTVDFTDGDDPFLTAIDAGEMMDESGHVPEDGRFWLVGSKVAASILRHDRTSKHEWSGDRVNSALGRGTIADFNNFRVVKSQSVPSDFSMFLQKTALVMGVVAPAAPMGANYSKRITDEGVSMLWILDYDPNFARDRSVVQVFSGITPVYDERVGGTGVDRDDLKTNYTGVGEDVPKSMRAVAVNYTPAAP